MGEVAGWWCVPSQMLMYNPQARVKYITFLLEIHLLSSEMTARLLATTPAKDGGLPWPSWLVVLVGVCCLAGITFQAITHLHFRVVQEHHDPVLSASSMFSVRLCKCPAPITTAIKALPWLISKVSEATYETTKRRQLSREMLVDMVRWCDCSALHLWALAKQADEADT